MRAFTALTALGGLVAGRVPEGSIVDDSPLVVLYYENWAGWIREFSPSHLENNFLSREFPVRNFVLNYAFFTWNPSECSMVQVDEIDVAKGDKGGWTVDDWNHSVTEDWVYNNSIGGHLPAFMALKARYPHIKLMPSLGGWSRSHTFHDCILNKMDHMVDSVVDNLIVWGWDGIDLDWEYPACDGATCGCQNEAVCPDGKGTANVAGAGDWGRYKTFVKALRSRFNTLEDQLGRRLYISAALGMNPKIIDGNNDVWSEPMPIEWMCDEDDFDFLNLMTYDFYGPWSPLTGPLAPLHPNDQLEGDQMSISDSLDRILARCSKPHKLNMGLATYGKSWAEVPKEGAVPGLWQNSAAPQIRAGGTYELGTLSYFDIKKNYLPVCERTFDDVSKTPTLYCASNPASSDIPYDVNVGPVVRDQKNVFITYEDNESWKAKMAYARSKGMAGAIIWASSDTGAGLGWCPDSTVDLMSGLFQGWFGEKVPLNEKANPWKPGQMNLKRWKNYPCPLVDGFIMTNQETSVSKCSGMTYTAGEKYLNFPVVSQTSATGESKMLIHPLGGAPDNTPPPATNPAPATTVAATTTRATNPAPVTTTPCPWKTTAATTTRATTTRANPVITTTPATTTRAATPAPVTTTRSATTKPNPPIGGDSAVADCQGMLTSATADWLKDCQDYCAYVYKTAWCPSGVDGPSLASCVTAAKPYCQL